MKRIAVFMLPIIAVLLSGCLYPESNLSKNQTPNEDQLRTVQRAVDEFQKANKGLLPIKNRPNETPIFQKYVIDFSKLKEQNFLSTTPGNAFQNGGIYQYMIIYPEKNPTVKLIDLHTTDVVREINTQLNIYRNENLYPPFGEEVAEGVFKVNYEELGIEEPPYVDSPYSQKHLPIVMDIDGELYIDYSADLYEALRKYDHGYTNGEDIRYLLAENTPFVPAYSLPYTVKDGEPVFLKEKVQKGE